MRFLVLQRTPSAHSLQEWGLQLLLAAAAVCPWTPGPTALASILLTLTLCFSVPFIAHENVYLVFESSYLCLNVF